MNESCSCEVPCWSGLWLETEGHGYMEVSDLDERHHKPPEGWELASVDVNIFNSSQIFRYVPVRVAVSLDSLDRATGLLAAVGVTGIAIVGLPIVQALLAPTGAAL